jgi:hypothetical protein
MYSERDITEATFFHEDELGGEFFWKDIHFLLMADNLLGESDTSTPILWGHTQLIWIILRKCSHACIMEIYMCYACMHVMYVYADKTDWTKYDWG